MSQSKVFLKGDAVYSCSGCRSHLALHDQLISTSFRGRTGRAFLFGNVTNVRHGNQEDRLLSTGLHTVSDIFCLVCEENVGWYYNAAFEPLQEYKVGKYIVEKAFLIKDVPSPKNSAMESPAAPAVSVSLS